MKAPLPIISSPQMLATSTSHTSTCKCTHIHAHSHYNKLALANMKTQSFTYHVGPGRPCLPLPQCKSEGHDAANGNAAAPAASTFRIQSHIYVPATAAAATGAAATRTAARRAAARTAAPSAAPSPSPAAAGAAGEWKSGFAAPGSYRSTG